MIFYTSKTDQGSSTTEKKQGAIPAFYDPYVDIPDIAGAVAKSLLL